MTQMIKCLKRIFARDMISKQIQLFSICGIAGLICAQLILGQIGYIEVTPMQRCELLILLAAFLLFFIGYETLFLHEKKLPEIDFSIFSIAAMSIPFSVFTLSTVIFLINFVLGQKHFMSFSSIVLSIPLTMFLAGYSERFEQNDATNLFKHFKTSDYITLLLKKLLILLLTYIITAAAVCIILFSTVLIYAAVSNTDILNIIFLNKYNTIKILTYITSILFIYILQIGTLVWANEVKETKRDSLY